MKKSCVRFTLALSLLGRTAPAAATAPPPSATPSPVDTVTVFNCDKRETDFLTGAVDTTTILSSTDRDEAVEACRLETVRSFGRGHAKLYSVSPSGEIQFDADPGTATGFERIVVDRLNFELAAGSSYLEMWSGEQLVGVVAFHDRYRPSLGLNTPGLSWAWSCGAMELLDYIHGSTRAVAIFVKDGHVQFARKLNDRELKWSDRPSNVARRFVRGSSAALEMQFEGQCAGTLREFTRTWF